MALLDHQWQLLSDDGSVDIIFGTAETGIQTSKAPELGQQSIRSADQFRVREDGVSFGTDYTEGTSLTFEANALSSGWAEQSDLLDDFRRAWGAEEFRNAPHRYGILKSCEAGRVRRCYGRPRRLAEVDADLTKDGYTGLVFDFATLDGLFYDDMASILSLPISPPAIYGLEDPLRHPLTMPGATETLGTVTVQGQRTWVTLTINGPVTNPSLEFGEDFAVTLNTTIPDGQSVTIDPRPWSRGVFRDDGANLAGLLSYDSPPLKHLKARPGTYVITYRGTDATGTSTAEVSWRTAHNRP